MNYANGLPADGYSYGKYGHTGSLDYEFWHEDGELIEKKTYSDDGGLIRHERFSTELGHLVEIPVPDILRNPRLAHYRQEKNSVLGIREIVILVSLLGLVLVKCLS